MVNASWDKAEGLSGILAHGRDAHAECAIARRRLASTSGAPRHKRMVPGRVRRCGCGVSHGGTLGAKPSYQIISPRFGDAAVCSSLIIIGLVR